MKNEDLHKETASKVLRVSPNPFDYADRKKESVNYVYATTNLDVPLALNPHYSDPRFSQGQTETVFGKESKNLHYSYSDRLFEWDSNAEREARFIATELGYDPRTGRWLQAYLSACHKRLATLKHVIVGVNVSNGYAYNCYGYILK